jgi:hypothetical protein
MGEDIKRYCFKTIQGETPAVSCQVRIIISKSSKLIIILYANVYCTGTLIVVW